MSLSVFYPQHICSWLPETFSICWDTVQCAQGRRQECELDIVFVRSTWRRVDRWRQWNIRRSVCPDWWRHHQPWYICRLDDARRWPSRSRSLRSSSTPAQMSPADRIPSADLRTQRCSDNRCGSNVSMVQSSWNSPDSPEVRGIDAYCNDCRLWLKCFQKTELT